MARFVAWLGRPPTRRTRAILLVVMAALLTLGVYSLGGTRPALVTAGLLTILTVIASR